MDLGGRRTLGGVVVAMALAVTLALGLLLRWALTGRVALPWDFAHVRHAHSHLGYFAVLFPLSWAAWAQSGAPTPGLRVQWAYGLATLVAFLGFLRAGYGPEAIAGSTIVGVVWLWSAWPLRKRMRDPGDLLAVVPLGVVGSLACVPPIALNLRTEPELAQGFVATFLAGLLLAVVVPSALAGRRARMAPWPLVAISAVAGAAALGVLPTPWMRAGLLLYGVLLLRAAGAAELPGHLRFAWGAVGLGLAGMALELVPNTRPVAVGAIHFLVLSPVLGSLLPPHLRASVPGAAWLLYDAGVGLLTAPLVLHGMGAGAWALLVSAVGGTTVVAWWLVVFVWQSRAAR